ncbi:hypothetical protein LPH56_08290 [Xylella taiwanensis]|uniref:Uncharacterized protein n=1 Tax=Xylella taiwanensis TaxID=1444770 RepID=Z9JLJ3_9GAMM|nr:hypothetical protein [Xylella taiwanensis]EWS78696.1 hypothetical protein AF72_03785 [Xylella taiwanensis]UFN40849.1 hypothetical protein LPH57_09220 [Xylella taiwanensis]UFS48986.1 hypothetical protein LPH54_08270 [Xylella taiwanensis]UFS51278.1 hypothetical protein LPH56_08290 [Xylella taiwanensis]
MTRVVKAQHISIDTTMTHPYHHGRLHLKHSQAQWSEDAKSAANPSAPLGVDIEDKQL